MDREFSKLEQLKSKMSPAQQKEMSDIIQTELNARERAKQKPPARVVVGKSAVNASKMSGGLSSDQVGQLYQDVQDALKKTRQAKSPPEAMNHIEIRADEPNFATARTAIGATSRRNRLRNGGLYRLAAQFPMNKIALALGVCVLAIAKILFSSGIVDASSNSQGSTSHLSSPTVATNPAETIASNSVTNSGNTAATATATSNKVSPYDGLPSSVTSDSVLLTQLDARRVELQRRNDALDKRELELKNQTRAMAERLAELRNLTTKLDEVRNQEEQKKDERLAQLSNVYGAMQPKEAAPLIGKLDDNIALSLLERMPGKRIAQILSLMDSDRAIELTKQLTSRGSGQIGIEGAH